MTVFFYSSRVSNHIVCSRYMDSVKNNQPPHIVLDTTITGIASETVKSLTSALGLPTVSASFGQEGDIRQWRALSDEKQNYLLQVMPPADIIPEVIRSIVDFMNITNAAILYDESFGMSIFHNYLCVVASHGELLPHENHLMLFFVFYFFSLCLFACWLFICFSHGS